MVNDYLNSEEKSDIWIKSKAKWLFGELLPHIAFFKVKRFLLNSAANPKKGVYEQVELSRLQERLIQDQTTRAKGLDEKTARLALSAAASLTIFTSVVGLFYKVEDMPKTILFYITVFLIVHYVFASILLSLGANRAMATYGYSTEFDIKNAEEVRKALISQELVNIIRSNRNEATYQCLRNAIYLLSFGLVYILFQLFLK